MAAITPASTTPPWPNDSGHDCPSVGRTGQCWDNSLGESFIATLKGGLLGDRPCPTQAAARRAIFEIIGAGTTSVACTAAWTTVALPTSRPLTLPASNAEVAARLEWARMWWLNGAGARAWRAPPLTAKWRRWWYAPWKECRPGPHTGPGAICLAGGHHPNQHAAHLESVRALLAHRGLQDLHTSAPDRQDLGVAGSTWPHRPMPRCPMDEKPQIQALQRSAPGAARRRPSGAASTTSGMAPSICSPL